MLLQEYPAKSIKLSQLAAPYRCGDSVLFWCVLSKSQNQFCDCPEVGRLEQIKSKLSRQASAEGEVVRVECRYFHLDWINFIFFFYYYFFLLIHINFPSIPRVEESPGSLQQCHCCCCSSSCHWRAQCCCFRSLAQPQLNDFWRDNIYFPFEKNNKKNQKTDPLKLSECSGLPFVDL